MLSKFYLLLLVICFSCNYPDLKIKFTENESQDQLLPSDNPFKQIQQIPLPVGFERTPASSISFATWLRNIHLKKSKTVYKFDGVPKANQAAQFAVIDISVGKQNLQQCADAVMRLRAEYLFKKKNFALINFSDNNGTSYNFQQPFTRNHFDSYLLKVFAMCGTASLAKQLKYNIELKNIQPGDVLIRGGFPGHAVIVMDAAINKEGKKIYLLAQSYMPAQDIHVLVNPTNKNLSPWYEVNDETEIKTPEYNFTKFELKRW